MAPLVLFVYDRLDHLRRCVAALLENELVSETDLIVYSDAARSPAAKPGVWEVRRFLTTISGFKSVKIIERKQNFGLAKSIIEGVAEVLSCYESIIVLEDDLVTAPYFLKYMNDALDFYRFEDRVVSIHGYVYPITDEVPEAFFLRGADCWGWATWRRGWGIFNNDGAFLLAELKRRNLISEFDFNGAYPYFEMLKNQVVGNNNSWAIRWYASAFLADKLTLYPGKSLVHNIGNDNSGTHCESSSSHDVALAQGPVRVDGMEVEHSEISYKSFERFFLTLKPGIFKRIFGKVSRLLR